MRAVIAWIWFVIGAVAGSVANAFIYRLPRDLSWVRGRSVCPKCKHELGFWDLIPVLSWIMLRGKCRYCHSPIPYRYLAVELFLGLSFVVINSHSWSFSGLILSAILWVTVVIAAMDWETMLVSDWMVLIWGGLVIVGSGIGMSGMWGLLLGVGVIGGIWILSKKQAMGEGDIGIVAVAGLWLGWPKIAPALWVAFVFGAAFGIWQLAIGRKKMKSRIPFGPFLILGSWIGYLWGDKIISHVFHF